MKRDIKSAITAEFIQLLKEHGAEWVKPFSELSGSPINAVTRRKYRGLNSFLLGFSGSTYWATYRQWNSVDAQVRRGEKARYISVPMPIKDKDSGEVKGILFKGASVFSAAQVDGWTAPVVSTVDKTTVLRDVDKYVTNTGADIRDNAHGGAYYRRSDDFINMPLRQQFAATESSSATETYYGTLLHELTHWTGHPARMHREMPNNDHTLGFEELTAEIGATMLCVALGVSPCTRLDHAQYVASWLMALDNNTDYVASAATQAQRAMDYLDTLQLAGPPTRQER